MPAKVTDADDRGQAEQPDERRGSEPETRQTPNARMMPTSSTRKMKRERNCASRKSALAHRRRDHELQRLLEARVHDREADAPDAGAHQVHAEEARQQEVDVARALLVDADDARRRRVRPSRARAGSRRPLPAARGARRGASVSKRYTGPAPAGSSTSSEILPVRKAVQSRLAVGIHARLQRGRTFRAPAEIADAAGPSTTPTGSGIGRPCRGRRSRGRAP